MKWFVLLAMVLSAGQAISATDDPTQPPVLRTSEPRDSVVVKLPGRPPAPPPVIPATEVHLAPPPADPDRPHLRRPKRDYPPEFEQDSADYLDRQIGIWQQIDAAEVLGESAGQRPAFGDDGTVNGRILAFADPTGRYKSFELDFDGDTGLLRTVFAYPQSMSWQDCRKAFGANVRSTQANKGRMFYSYLDRRLDVLVDSVGKVISLGMY